MTVDELRRWLSSVPGDTTVAVAILEHCGTILEPLPGMGAGVTFELDDDTVELMRVWITATPTRVAPVDGDYLCPCGAHLRFGPDTAPDRVHADCE